MLEVVERKDLVLAEEAHLEIDAAEDYICSLDTVLDPAVDQPELTVEHVVTPGLYRRTLRAKRDVFATTYIHKQTHQYVLTAGKVAISLGNGESIEVEAPCYGITQAGTRRAGLVLEDVEWTTFHSIPEGMTDIGEIEAYVFEIRERPDGTTAKQRIKEALAKKELAS